MTITNKNEIGVSLLQPRQRRLGIFKEFHFAGYKPGSDFRRELLPFFAANDSYFFKFAAVFKAQSEIIPGGSQLPTLEFRGIDECVDFRILHTFQCRIDQRRDFFVVCVGEFSHRFEGQKEVAVRAFNADGNTMPDDGHIPFSL